jgi:hypothetical protein
MEARRRQRMAEMLAQQEFNPANFPNAPIPSAYPIARALKGFLSGREEALAEKALEKAQAADIAGERELREKLGPRSQIAAPTNTQIAESVGMPQIAEDGTVSYGQTTMPKLGMEQVMPTAQERERVIEDALFSGTPRAQKYAQFLTAKEPQSELMEFGGQLVNVRGDVATPVTMGGQIISKPQEAKAPSTVGGMMWDSAQGKFVPIPGYEDQAKVIAAAKRPDVVVQGDKGPSETAMWRAEDSLRNDFEQITEPFRSQLSDTQKITEIINTYGNDPRAIEAIPQQSLVILLNKFLDPNSVVREGEFSRVVDAQGLVGQAKNIRERVLKGKPLDASTITQIANLAKLYERAADSKIRQYANEYASIASGRKLNVNAVITNPNYRPREPIADSDVEVVQ